MKENDIEDMFKDKFEDFEPEVDSKVWKNVKTGIKVAGAGAIGKFLISKLGTNAIIAIVSSIATLIGTVAIMNWTGAGKDKPIAEKPKVFVAPPKQLTPEEIKEFLRAEEGSTSNTIHDVNNVKPEVVPAEKANKIPARPADGKPEGVAKTIKPKEIANIQASSTSGTTPLIVDVSNIGKGKKNTWILGDKQNNNASPAYFFDVPGIYTIKLLSVNKDGQMQKDSINIEVIAKSEVDVPKYSLSPNGDGKNDFFGINPQNLVKLDAGIYDKDGNLVYGWIGIDGKWDGTNTKGELAKAGTYYFIFKYIDEAGDKSEHKGTVKLIR